MRPQSVIPIIATAGSAPARRRHATPKRWGAQWILTAIVLAIATGALAQSSEGFTIESGALNQGGRPDDGTVATSTSFTLSLDAIGDGPVPALLASTSFQLDGGLVAAYPPPGEVLDLALSGTALAWSPERSVGDYAVYRGALGSFGGYGICFDSGLGSATTTDPAVPAAGTGYFYLVTARNRLTEEGTKGWDSAPTERPNPSPCP